MIGQTVDAGDHFKKRAALSLAPCTGKIERKESKFFEKCYKPTRF